MDFEYIGYFIVSAFSQTVVTFIGQNYGAGQYGRCKKILRLCLAGGMIGTLLVSAVFIFTRGTVIRIFTVDPAEIEYAMARFLYVMPFLFLTSTYEIVGSALRGMGRSTLPAVFTLLGTVVFRVFWVYVIFPLWNSFPALVIVYPISWVLTGTMMILYYFGQRGKLFAEVHLVNRPYVICHILSSLNGKINGSFMAAEATRTLGGEYGRIRREMDADAWLYGTTTVKEFLNYRELILEETSGVPEGDFVAGDETKPYFVALDTKGELGWESGRFANKGRAEAHVIEIFTEAAPLSYRAYLRKRGVSYILAGKTELDCKVAMEKLHRLFHIKKLLICGGGTASVFSQIPTSSAGKPVEFELKAVERIGDGGLYLNYLVKNARQAD